VVGLERLAEFEGSRPRLPKGEITDQLSARTVDSADEGSPGPLRQPHLAPLLGHIHLPKTGGTSVMEVLSAYYGSAHKNLYFNNPPTTFVYQNDQVAEFVQDVGVKAFSSHFVRRFPPVLAGRPVYYITSLRDPVQQFISYITDTRKRYATFTDPVLVSHLPPRMPELTIRDCARWILDRPSTVFLNFRDNYATNFYACSSVLDSYGLEYADPRYRSVRSRTARDILSRFLMVGITECLDESWTLLRWRAAKVGIDLPNVRMPVRNVSANLRESLDWIHAGDEVGARLLDSIREDLSLYRWARRRFRRQRLRFMLENQLSAVKRLVRV
jgi:hypothetical protein